MDGGAGLPGPVGGNIRGWPYKRGEDPGGPRRGRWFGDGAPLSGRRLIVSLILAFLIIVIAVLALM